MTESIPATQAAQRRRRMDIFDPSEDGVKGYTLEKTVRAADHVLDAFDRLEEAILGCKTPLSLRETSERLKELREQVAEEVAALGRARDIIETDAPILHAVTKNPASEPPEARTLGPHRLIQFNELSLTMENVKVSTYREWSGTAAVPQLVRDLRARRAVAARVAAAVAKEDPAMAAEREAKQAATNAKRAASRSANRAAKVDAGGAGAIGPDR
jgi:hypothetical protein